MAFARWIFWIAGVYGLLVLIPGFFLERQAGEAAPPAILNSTTASTPRPWSGS